MASERPAPIRTLAPRRCFERELLSHRAADDPLDALYSASSLAPKVTAGAAAFEEIVVTGIRQTSYSDDSWNWAGDSSSTATGSSGGSGGTSSTSEPLPTRCVGTTFSTQGATTTDANRAALAASNAIAGLDDETFEYSSIIFDAGGNIGWTQPYTDHSTSDVNWLGGIDQVPSGAVILGILHNHPDVDGINDTIPSPTNLGGLDWSAYDQLESWGGTRGITVDQNALMWIYSNDDNKTHVYDGKDRETTQTSCSLQP